MVAQERGFRPTRELCGRCRRANWALYRRGHESLCIRCFALAIDDPREREELAAALVPDREFAILSGDERPPWERR